MLALSFTLLLLAYAITLLGATSSAVSELRSRSLELLLSTPMSPATIVGGKLAGVATLAAPAVLGAIALLALGLPEFSPALRWEWYDDPADLAGLRRRFAATTLCVLVSVAYLATSTLALTLRARTSARAWTAALGNGTLLALGPPVLAVSSRGRGALGELSELLNPMLSSSFFGREDVPDMAFVSAAFWAVMTGLAFLIACRAVARRVA
jgi:ABC-type Na+ efflux pump permease subunit